MPQLDIRIVSAENLPNVQTFGKIDPYCQIALEGKTFSTKYADNTTAPKWDEVFKFNVADADASQIHLRVWNKNNMSDDFLGEAHVSLAGLKRGVVDDRTVLLKNCKSNAELRIRLMAKDFGAIASEQPQPPQHQQQQTSYPPPPQQGAYPPQQPAQQHQQQQGSGYPPQQAYGAPPPQQQGGYPPAPPQPYGAPPVQPYAQPMGGGAPQTGYPGQQQQQPPGVAPPMGGYAPPQPYGAPPSGPTDHHHHHHHHHHHGHHHGHHHHHHHGLAEGIVVEIVPKHHHELRLDVVAAGSTNGTKLHVWQHTGAPNQRFRVHQRPHGAGFSFHPLCAPSHAIDNDNGHHRQVQLWEAQDGNANQDWAAVDQGDGWYMIVNGATGDALDVAGHGGQGVALITWAKHGKTNQQFRFQRV